jgi:monoamine oxidase
MMRLSAAAAGAAVLSPVLDWSAYAKKEQPKASIGIVGGGVAGLTAAYRLQQQGVKPVLFEASNRWGGRMFTRCNFYKGMFCELGGELVDTNHDDLLNLLAEFSICRQKLDVGNEAGQDLYFFKGALLTDKDLLDPQKQSGAFRKIAKQIKADAKGLKINDKTWTAHACELDHTSLKDYLENFRGKADDWVIDLLDVAYVGECGLETQDLSSLNLVNFIGTDLTKDFQLFGDSDEAWRIEGGSSKLIEALVDALKDKIEMNRRYALTGIDDENGRIALSFDAPGGAQHRTFDAVILALPFTCLRNVDGLAHLGLSDKKLKCIRELGMGQSAKIMVGTTSRVWRSPESDLRVHNLRVPSDGSILSDLRFQDFWETSRNQRPLEAGILTVFLGGKAAETDEKSALATFRDGLAKISPKMAESVDPNAVTSMFWTKDRAPYTLGSYSAAKVGQYTTMLDEAWKPALNGRLQFAGEHTAGADYFGYMNAGVRSGNRAAKALLKIMALPAFASQHAKLCSDGESARCWSSE